MQYIQIESIKLLQILIMLLFCFILIQKKLLLFKKYNKQLNQKNSI